MNIHQIIAGALSATFLSGTVAAEQPAQAPVETRTSASNPFAACYIKSQQEQQIPETKEAIGRREICLLQAEAVLLLKKGRTQEALEVMLRIGKPKPEPSKVSVPQP